MKKQFVNLKKIVYLKLNNARFECSFRFEAPPEYSCLLRSSITRQCSTYSYLFSVCYLVLCANRGEIFTFPWHRWIFYSQKHNANVPLWVRILKSFLENRERRNDHVDLNQLVLTWTFLNSFFWHCRSRSIHV